MAQNVFRLALAFAITLPVLSNPTPTTLHKRQTCQGQSCVIADLSGSTGDPYDPSSAPSGGTDSGDCCILTYNPSAASVLYSEKPELKSECASSSKYKRAGLPSSQISTAKRATCSPYTLIFARGTFEAGTLGDTVGPALEFGLDAAAFGKWDIEGVSYDASEAGDDCLGLPGGAAATSLLESYVSSCPDTKIILSGYSQGAMVVHNGVAYASAAAKARVSGVVVFGDPFDGAKIKGYNGPIQTYCVSGDQVCDGEFSIGLAHLSYVGIDTSAAVSYISSLVG